MRYESDLRWVIIVLVVGNLRNLRLARAARDERRKWQVRRSRRGGNKREHRT